MLLTILGLAILIFPFLLLSYFKNKIIGFSYILVAVVFFHTILALVSQYFHVFNYFMILVISILVVFCISFFLIRDRANFSFKIKINWLLLAALLIIIFQLYSVHYSYTGQVNTINGNKRVFEQTYSYPYFSDEWASVAFINYSIDNNSLATVNPLIDGKDHPNFRNIFIAFIAFLAEIFLLLNLTPLLAFPVLTIFTGTIICFLIFLYLKSVKVRNSAAVFSALSLPWIVNSVNLPGIWYLFPFILGLIFFLISLIATSYKEKRLIIFSSFLSLFLYPPLIVLVVPVLFFYFLQVKPLSVKRLLKIIGLNIFLVLIIAGIIFLTQIGSSKILFQFFKDSLLRNNYDGTIATRAIWRIIPVAFLPFSFLGIFYSFYKKIYNFLIPLFISLSFWLVYAYYPKFFIIDYARIAVVASYLVIISTGLGLEGLLLLLEVKYPRLFAKKQLFNTILSAIIILVFVNMSFFYTRREAWTHIRLIFDTPLGVYERPVKAPVNNFLNQDDLDLFEGISKTRFLSIPWKGLVIGVATNNYPLEAKPSIITNRFASYGSFMNSDCEVKKDMATEHKIVYVYATFFNCQNFKKIGSSGEGLILYKFNSDL